MATTEGFGHVADACAPTVTFIGHSEEILALVSEAAHRRVHARADAVSELMCSAEQIRVGHHPLWHYR